MPYSTQDFAAMVKAKYPDYANIPDDQLVAKVLAKYPEYAASLDARSNVALRRATPPPAATGDPDAPQLTTAEKYLGPIAHPVDTGKAFVGAIGSGLWGVAGAVAHPIDTVNADLATRKAAFERLKSRGINSDDPETLRDATEMSLPFVGHAFAQAGRQMNSPRPADQSKGFGSALALVAGPEMLKDAIGTPAAISRGVRNAVSPTWRADVASQISNKTIAATKGMFRFGKNPGSEVAGLTYDSPEDLIPQLDARMETYDSTIQKVLNSPAARTKVIDHGADIRAAFQEPIDLARRNGREAQAANLEAARDARIEAAKKLSGGSELGTPAQAQLVKKQLGADTKWSPNMDETARTINDAMQDAYTNIDRSLDSAIPATKALNQRYANAIAAKKAAESLIENNLRSDPVNPFKVSTYANSLGVRSRVAAAIHGTPNTLDVNALPETEPSPTYQAPVRRMALSGAPVRRLLPPSSMAQGDTFTMNGPRLTNPPQPIYGPDSVQSTAPAFQITPELYRMYLDSLNQK